MLLEEIEANNDEAEQCRADIAANEACRRDIQAKIEKAIDTNNNVNFLKILSTFRIQVGNCCRGKAGRSRLGGLVTIQPNAGPIGVCCGGRG